MKYSWDLKRLYMKIEDFYLDMTLIRDKIKVLCSHREIKIDGNSLYELMSECFSIREMNFKTLLYASLNYYLDINNDSNIKMKQQAEELDSFVGSETSFIDELLCVFEEDKLNLLYEENSKLLDYKFYIDTVRRNSKYFVSNNKIPVSSMYALLILFFWNSKLPSDGNIIKNVHQPLNNKLYF